MGGPERNSGAAIVCVVGPTASGKTGVLARVAERLPVEVISLDSRQIYRGLAIGTAQPTAEEQRVCPHHLIDFLPLDETYDAARFREDFAQVYAEIRGRGAVPVLAGGAGFYLRALTHGFMDLPPLPGVDLADLRAEIEALSDEEVSAELGRVDPESLARIHPHDSYRLRRALEIHRLTGKSMTEHMAGWRPSPCLGLDYRVAVLDPERKALDRRIRQRTQAMLEAGWMEETRTALERYPSDAPGLQCIGYPALVLHLQGGCSLAEAVEEVVLQTRQYAKRQRTWFRKVDAVGRRDPEDPRLADELEEMIRTC